MADLTKWKLVPVEPTEEMQEAGYLVMSDGDGSCADTVDTYRAMLSAAPAPSLPTREEIARVLRESIKVDAIFGFDAAADAILALFAQPQGSTKNT